MWNIIPFFGSCFADAVYLSWTDFRNHFTLAKRQTRQDAITNIKEAIEGYVLTLQDDGLQVPDDPFDTIVVAV